MNHSQLPKQFLYRNVDTDETILVNEYDILEADKLFMSYMGIKEQSICDLWEVSCSFIKQIRSITLSSSVGSVSRNHAEEVNLLWRVKKVIHFKSLPALRKEETLREFLSR